MIRLLIADDEKMIRETICSIIDWESLNIQVVGVCKNGLEAYDAILDEYPDIVLTDIRMPKLSGLELIRKITENHDHIQFIILSGYNEFSYAREAMRYGIKHYILKPCSEEEITEAVKDCIKEYYKKLTIENMKQDIKTVHSLLGENLMFHILFQTLSSNENSGLLPELYEGYVDFYHTSYQLCYIYFLEEQWVDTCREKIQKLFQDSCLPHSFPYVYVKNTLTFFFMDTQKSYSFMDSLLENINLGIGSQICSYHRESYSSLIELLNTLSKKVKRYETIHLFSGSQKTIICNYDFLFHQTQELANQLLLENDTLRHTRLLDDLKKLLSSVKSLELLRSLINSILMKASQTCTCFSSGEITDMIKFISSVSSNEEICSFIFEKLHTLLSVPLLGSKKYKPFIQEILNYTNSHISEPDLTLKWIVENHLFMNVDYVSRQFVLQTGVKFSTYLNDLRIQKAKQLLINCDSEKIYYVAEQVGCGNNPQYFSHLFKKYTKLTPKEYALQMKASPHNNGDKTQSVQPSEA